jgi:hypothetical protein
VVVSVLLLCHADPSFELEGAELVLLDDGSRLLRAVVDDGVEVRPGLELPLPVDGSGQWADHEPRPAVIEVLVQVAAETDGLRCLAQTLTNGTPQSSTEQQTMSGELRLADADICSTARCC